MLVKIQGDFLLHHNEWSEENLAAFFFLQKGGAKKKKLPYITISHLVCIEESMQSSPECQSWFSESHCLENAGKDCLLSSPLWYVPVRAHREERENEREREREQRQSRQEGLRAN